MIQNLPKALAGQPRELHVSEEVDPDGGPMAGVSYGGNLSLSVAEQYVTEDTASGEPETLDARDLLSASFLLGYACDPRSYQGTAPSRGGGLGPAGSNKPTAGRVWFSCRIDGAEGSENSTSEALGWTSEKTAWLIVGPDQAAVEALVYALRTSR